jgi:molybdate transport system regulatory protein
MSKPPAPMQTDARLWFRILLPSGALGPGKIALMRAVAASGSVSAAARTLRMSHARSVKLVAEINSLAPTPLIDTRAGGQAGGGASLTPLGLAVVEAYAAVECRVSNAADLPLAMLEQLLRPASDAD